MGKKLLLIVSSLILFASNTVIAEDTFDSLADLTPEQKRQLTIIHSSYKTKNNELLNSILGYTDKIARLKLDPTKTPNQIALFLGAYERNIESLKDQQRKLDKETDELYRFILTENQYKQYRLMHYNAQIAFDKFLQK